MNSYDLGGTAFAGKLTPFGSKPSIEGYLALQLLCSCPHIAKMSLIYPILAHYLWTCAGKVNSLMNICGTAIRNLHVSAVNDFHTSSTTHLSKLSRCLTQGIHPHNLRLHGELDSKKWHWPKHGGGLGAHVTLVQIYEMCSRTCPKLNTVWHNMFWSFQPRHGPEPWPNI